MFGGKALFWFWRSSRALLLGSAPVLFSAGSMMAWDWHRDRMDRANVEKLNRWVAEYRERTGRCPDLNMIALFQCGISDQRLHRTPYGGTYHFDPITAAVYNPHRPVPAHASPMLASK